MLNSISKALTERPNFSTNHWTLINLPSLNCHCHSHSQVRKTIFNFSHKVHLNFCYTCQVIRFSQTQNYIIRRTATLFEIWDCPNVWFLLPITHNWQLQIQKTKWSWSQKWSEDGGQRPVTVCWLSTDEVWSWSPHWLLRRNRFALIKLPSYLMLKTSTTQSSAPYSL